MGLAEAWSFNARLQPCQIQATDRQSQAVLAGLELYYGNEAAACGTTTVMPNNGNVRKQKILPLGVARSFEYTGGGRLLSKAVARTAEQVLTVCQGDWSGSACTGRFDGAGRPLKKSYSDGTEGLTYEYDANGNMTQWQLGGNTITGSYDVENRLVSAASDVYKYNAANQRVVVGEEYADPRYSVFGLNGELLGEYRKCGLGGGYYVPCNRSERVYFAGRYMQKDGNSVMTDRLGSAGAVTAYPYGEANEEFATYRKDSQTGLHYAWNRNYSATWGRFASVDPFQQSAGPTNPQSWNRYRYVLGDPVNSNDPSGLMASEPEYYCDPDYGGECVLRMRLPFGPGGGGQDQNPPSPPPPEGPCDKIGKQILDTINGKGMPGGKSLLARVIENIVGSSEKFDGHMEEIQNYRNRLIELRQDWNDNDCDGKPPHGVDGWLNETTRSKIKERHDRYQDIVQEMKMLGVGYLAYKALRLVPSLLFPPSLVLNLAIP